MWVRRLDQSERSLTTFVVDALRKKHKKIAVFLFQRKSILLAMTWGDNSVIVYTVESNWI